MIRFRTAEDEKKYNILRAEIYRRVAQGLPPAVVNDVLRNLAKIETMLHLEGLRQGLAIAAVVDMDTGIEKLLPLTNARGSKAYQAHALVYGSSDTPLAEVEHEWMDRMHITEEPRKHPWLDQDPMRFAATPVGTATQPQIVERITVAEPMPATPRVVVDGELRAPMMSDEELQAFLDLPEAPEGTPPLQPAFLDRIRTMLKPMLEGGWKPPSWPEMIMKLHLAMAEDAGAIDLVLATPEGRALLDQCGLFDMQPGGAMNQAEFATEGQR